MAKDSMNWKTMSWNMDMALFWRDDYDRLDANRVSAVFER
jgi:hypothetical protein